MPFTRLHRAAGEGQADTKIPVGGVGFVFDGRPDQDGLVFGGVDFDHVISASALASLVESASSASGPTLS